MGKKYTGFFVAVVVLVATILSSVFPALACGGGPALLGFDDPQAPKAIVLAAFASLSQQLNTRLDPTVVPWQWNEDVFGNSALECPAPGQAVDKTLTRGYRLMISVLGNNDRYTSYLYRATKDGKVLFQCTLAGPGPLIPVAA